MRSRSVGKIFKLMMTDNQSRMLYAEPNAHHPRVTIRVREINIPGDKNFLIIRTSWRQNEHAQDRDLDNPQSDATDSLHKIDNRKSTIENRK